MHRRRRLLNGLTALSLLLCAAMCSQWRPGRGLSVGRDGSYGWDHQEDVECLGFSVTQIHAVQGPVLVYRAPDAVAVLVIVLTALLPARWLVLRVAKGSPAQLDGGRCLH